MYLRHTTIRKDGKVHRYWRLVRSVRVGRRVIQQVVAHLGELDEHGRVGGRVRWARRLIGAPEQARLFDDGSEHLTVPVRLKGIRIERAASVRRCVSGACTVAWERVLRICVRDCCRPARSALHGRRWRPCWWQHASASHRVSCTLQKTGIDARRCQICCSSARRRSTRIASIAPLDHLLAHKGRTRSAFVAALRRAVCSRERGAALRRHEHLF